MAKTLKEALLEQMAALRERGLVTGELPVEQEEAGNPYADYDDESTRHRGGDRGDARRNRPGQRPKRAGGPRLREMREDFEGRENRQRERRDHRGEREGVRATPPPELVEPAGRPMVGPRPVGPRPPGPGGFRPPLPGGPRPPVGPGRSDLLRRRAEQRQREQNQIAEITTVLGELRGTPADEAAREEFLAALKVETGELPPPHVVVQALRAAGSDKPADVAHQVRLHYRRARSRPASRPAAPAPAPAPVPAGVS